MDWKRCVSEHILIQDHLSASRFLVLEAGPIAATDDSM